MVRELAALKRRAIHSRNENVIWAWHTAWLQRVEVKKFPKLEKLLIDPDRKPARRMSQEELLANMKLAFGYPGKADTT